MLGTIVIDKYNQNNSFEIAKALEVITIENNQVWSTAGIYCFWNYYNKEILYIGLAVDLLERFKQHNGLVNCKPNSCKKIKVDNYFLSNEYIGFSIILQLALSQPINQKQKLKYASSFDNKKLINVLGKEGADEIRYTEGALLEGFRNNNGRLPEWNEIGGSVNAQKLVKGKNVKFLKYLVSMKPNKYISRVSLTELCKNTTYQKYESYLHSIRISPFPSIETIKIHKQKFNNSFFDEIAKSGYFNKRLNI